MSVYSCKPQMMNRSLPRFASTGQHPGSRNVPLTSLISAFIFPPLSPKSLNSMEPDHCSEQKSGSVHVLHVQQDINPPYGCLEGTNVTNNSTNLTRIWLKSPSRQISHLISSHPSTNHNFSSIFTRSLIIQLLAGWKMEQ